MKKIIVGLLISGFTLSAYSGINGITYHSRANCVNNETITWDLTTGWWLTTSSYHDNPAVPEHHHASSSVPPPDEYVGPAAFTRRSAAVHWGEAPPLISTWDVSGLHYAGVESNKVKLVSYSWARDCSIYDGWWEMKDEKLEND